MSSMDDVPADDACALLPFDADRDLFIGKLVDDDDLRGGGSSWDQSVDSRRLASRREEENEVSAALSRLLSLPERRCGLEDAGSLL